MLLSIAERRAAEPCCMAAVIQPTVLLWLYGYRPAHSVSWLVPIFQVSRPSGVLGHASSVMTGFWGVKSSAETVRGGFSNPPTAHFPAQSALS